MNTTTISKWGNSFAIRIPKAVIERVRFREGDTLELDMTENGGLILRPTRRPFTLEELVQGITPDNCCTETDWGEARGHEAW